MGDYAWGLLAGLALGLLALAIAKLRERRRPMTPSQQADNLSRRRMRILPPLLLLYLTQQASFLGAGDGTRAVDHVRLGAWAVLTLIMLATLVTRGFRLVPAAVRDMIDGEGTRLNRLLAVRSGFTVAILAGIVIYVVQPFVQVSLAQALHLVISASLGVALLHFALLEWRGHREAEQ